MCEILLAKYYWHENQSRSFRKDRTFSSPIPSVSYSQLTKLSRTLHIYAEYNLIQFSGHNRTPPIFHLPLLCESLRGSRHADFRSMKSIFLALLIAGSCLFPFVHPQHHSVSASDDANGASFVIAGYLPDYRAYINVNATAIHLTDLMIFSLTPESILQSSSSPCCLSSDHYDKIRKARSYKREQQHSKQIRLLLTVGGGGRSNGFRDVVTGNSQMQRQFIKRLVQLW